MATDAPFDIGALIEAVPGVSGGRACLAGTGFPIVQLAIDYSEGMSPDEILAEYPHLGLARIYAGIAYYLANKAAIDAEIEAEGRAYTEALSQDRAERARASA